MGDTLVPMGRVVSIVAFCLVLAACGSQSSSTAALAIDTVVLDTPCLSVEGLVLPDNYIAADVSPAENQCWFVTQLDGAADVTVIAGELWKSSGGNSFDDFVGFMEMGLSQGQEPDLLPLRLLNTGASGRELPILNRQEIDGPNRATIFTHESDRRDGFQAMSAVVDFDTDRDADTTVIFMWGLVTDTNLELFPELINSMELKTDFDPN